MTESKIMEYWGFDDVDLGANRLGQLTEKQKKFLAGEHKSQRGVFLGIGALVIILFCCFPAVLLGARSLLPMLLSNRSSNPMDMIQIIAFGGFGIIFLGTLALIIGGVAAFYVLRANKKIDITVRKSEGEVGYTWETKRVRAPNSSVRNYEDVQVLKLNIGNEKFEVKEVIKEMIREDESWTIYYTSYPFKFLSAEKVE